MARSTTARPRWQRRPSARPEEILDAAFQVFGEEGFARTKLDDVARSAGVSKGTLYLYFDSKETLFREMVRAKILPAVQQARRSTRRDNASRFPWQSPVCSTIPPGAAMPTALA